MGISNPLQLLGVQCYWTRTLFALLNEMKVNI